MKWHIVTSVLGVICLFSCERKSYVSHKIKLEATGKSCEQISASFRMTSNMGGERYELEKCLPKAFDKSTVTSYRQGDTVVVKMNGQAGTDVWQVTLDIDSYPAYRFLTIDNDTYQIGPSRP